MKIVPMRELKNTVKIEKLCSETNGPVFITKNGYGKLVVMDIQYFENLMNQVYEAMLVNQGIKDLKDGKVHDGVSVLEELKTKYGLWKKEHMLLLFSIL